MQPITLWENGGSIWLEKDERHISLACTDYYYDNILTIKDVESLIEALQTWLYDQMY